MAYVFGHGVFAADVARVDAVALASLLHGVVAAVEVLALLEGLAEVVGAVGEFAVQAEEALFFGGEGLLGGGGCLSVDRLSRWMGRGWCTYAHVNLVLLVGIHLGYQFFVSKTWWKQRKGVLGVRIV